MDADIGLNGELVYSLLAPSPFFYLEPRSGWLRTFRRLEPGTFVVSCQVEDRASRLFRSPAGQTEQFVSSVVNVTVRVRVEPSPPPRLSATALPMTLYTPGLQRAALLSLSDPEARLELSAEARRRGDALLEPVSASQYLLYMAAVERAPPAPVSFLLRASADSAVFTAENISLQLDTDSRRLWFGGAAEEDETPRVRLGVDTAAPNNSFVHCFAANTTYEQDAALVK